MARIRGIKPDFFDDPTICDLSAEAALVFIGLWPQADRAGRLLDEPRRLKVRIRPMSKCNMDAILTELADAGLIIRYKVDGVALIQVKNFEKHQRPHHQEPESVLPPVSAGFGESPKPSGYIGSNPPVMVTVTETVTETVTDHVASRPARASADDFAVCWGVYPRKTGKGAALKAWQKQKPDRAVVLAALDWQRTQPQWVKDGGQFIPHMATWLNQRRWEDEPDAPRLTAVPRAELGSWRDECDRDHGGACGNQHFHAAKMRSQAVSA